jgi:choline dehydrogenase-like flavoprotein
MSGFLDANGSVGQFLKPEVCIIGSGAGGAVAAALLAAAGRSVLVVEEGGHRTSQHFRMREDEAFAQLYQESGARATKDLGITILQGRTVGGTTVVNWTTSFRTPDTVLEHSPAELAPHFAAVEERLSIAEIPLEESNRNNRLLYEGCKAIGLPAAPTRRNVKRCMKSGYCGMGCPIDAKQSMLVTYLPDAVAKGATVIYRCRVDRLELEGDRVVRAQASILDPEDGHTPTGRLLTIEAKRFLLSAGAINSPAILIRSGLGGKDSPVGRRTFLHPVAAVTGRYQDPVEGYYGAPQSIASHALAHRGDGIGLFLEAAPIHPVLASTALTGIGQAHRAAMRELSRLTGHLALAIDGFDPSETGGTVEVRPSGAPVVDYPLPPRVWEGLRTGTKMLARINLAAGADLVRTAHDPAVEIRSEADLAKIDAAPFESNRVGVFSAHVMGGCALGGDPKSAVVRPDDLRHHRVQNLHIVDGSVLPTSLGVNPQETIYGIAHLVAGRLDAAWGPRG